MRDGFLDGGNECIHLLGSVGTPEGKANAGARSLRREADGSEDVRWFHRPARACRAGGDGKAAQVKRDDQRLAFDSVEIDVARVRRPAVACAVSAGSGNTRED